MSTVAPSVRHVATVDGAVLLDVSTGRCFGLNPTGSVVWRALCDGASVEQVVGELAARYAADQDRIRADVLGVIATLGAAGLLIHPVPS